MAEKKKKYGVKNPNEGTDGKLASNMTGEAIQPNYDYGNITDNDKKVVKEINPFVNKLYKDFLTELCFSFVCSSAVN